MSLAQRRKMVNREHPSLSMTRQCALLGVSRPGLYYRSRGVSSDDLALMQAMDRQYLETPFYGSRRMRAWLERQGTVANHIGDIVVNNNRAYYTLTESRAKKWMHGLGAALSISLPEGETPLDWAIAQCNQLPLSTWDADDLPEKFRLAGDVAQIELTVALYAVLAWYETGHDVEPEMVRNLAEKAWEHCHFLSQQETYWLEEPELDELAARVVLALGSPSEEWLLIQAKNPQVGPRGLWAIVDAYIEKNGFTNLGNELGSSIAARYRNSKATEISTLRYLAKIWQLQEAVDAAFETAEIMIEYHHRAMERKDYVVAMGLLLLSARHKGATSKMRRDIRSLYEYLWHTHIPSEEEEIKQSVDALLA